MTNRSSFFERHALTIAMYAPLLPHVVGSIFNTWYNLSNIDPLFVGSQRMRFVIVVAVYNLLVYPLLIFAFIRWFASVKVTWKKLRVGECVDDAELRDSQRKVINSPWAFMATGTTGWFLCIPVFLIVMFLSPEPLHHHVKTHLSVSFVIAGLIAISQSIFVAELCSMRFLYPTFFPLGGAAKTPGAYPLNLQWKGVVWALSAVVCPIVSLLLLFIAPHEARGLKGFGWFAVSVSGLAIVFGLVSAYLLGRLVTEPVAQLASAAKRIGEGDFQTRIETVRADDFGPLIDRFNQMTDGLSEKEHLQETLGRHVGEAAAKEILRRDALTGDEKDITIMFCDIRNFTQRSSKLSPPDVVRLLNLFLSRMVEIVEDHNGMVNKFLGDGFMALFGAGQAVESHADDAVKTAGTMLAAMESVNRRVSEQGFEPIEIGIGIHSGEAIVGSIGSLQRLEYTAIGDAVNVAARIESLTKTLGHRVLLSDSTKCRLQGDVPLLSLPPQKVKGKPEPVGLFAMEDSV